MEITVAGIERKVKGGAPAAETSREASRQRGEKAGAAAGAVGEGAIHFRVQAC